MADRKVEPDGNLLNQIFTDSQPQAISIFIQNWTKCVFKAEFSDNTAYVVRLEAEDASSGTFTTIAAMQQIAATILPDLVPKTIRIGKARNVARRVFQFSVIELVQGDLLDQV